MSDLLTAIHADNIEAALAISASAREPFDAWKLRAMIELINHRYGEDADFTRALWHLNRDWNERYRPVYAQLMTAKKPKPAKRKY